MCEGEWEAGVFMERPASKPRGSHRALLPPVEGAPRLHRHPVDGKVHLPHKGGHAYGHGVGGTQDHAGLLPHDPVGGDMQSAALSGPGGPFPFVSRRAV